LSPPIDLHAIIPALWREGPRSASFQLGSAPGLTDLVPVPAPELVQAWDLVADKLREDEQPKKPLKGDSLPEAFYVLITCRNEAQQAELLGRFKGEGLDCKPVLGLWQTFWTKL
jgi:hypothetical protein